MNIKGLRAFTRIMATGTLNAAADSLHISESALSRQLSILESELKLTLFSREKRQLVPTPEGEAFHAEAERLLDAIEQIPDIAEQIRRGQRLHMRVTLMPRVAGPIGVPAISRFQRESPDVEISVELQPRQNMERWLASHQFDLGIGALPSNHAAIEVEQICRVPAVAIMAADHPLAKREALELADLAAERMILMPRTTLVGHHVARLLENADMVPAANLHVSATSIGCAFAAEGHGVIIADALIPHSFGAAVRIVPIEPRSYFRFGLLYPRDKSRTPETERLIDIIKTQAADYVAELGFE